MSKAVIEMALEALKVARDQIVDPEYAPIGWSVSRLDEVLEALTKLAEQPALAHCEAGPEFCQQCNKEALAQRTWVGLTDEDKCTVELDEAGVDPNWIDGYKSGLKDAEAKLKEQNT